MKNNPQNQFDTNEVTESRVGECKYVLVDSSNSLILTINLDSFLALCKKTVLLFFIWDNLGYLITFGLIGISYSSGYFSRYLGLWTFILDTFGFILEITLDIHSLDLHILGHLYTYIYLHLGLIIDAL